jgi:hypothetical protein
LLRRRRSGFDQIREVTEFLLSAERRDELATLLDDDTRFRAEYPAVANYLDTAPRLPWSGDDDVDRAFDIRLLHYMTGGSSENPCWDRRSTLSTSDLP